MKLLAIFGIAFVGTVLISVLLAMYIFVCVVVYLIDTFFGDFEYHAYP